MHGVPFVRAGSVSAKESLRIIDPSDSSSLSFAGQRSLCKLFNFFDGELDLISFREAAAEGFDRTRPSTIRAGFYLWPSDVIWHPRFVFRAPMSINAIETIAFELIATFGAHFLRRRFCCHGGIPPLGMIYSLPLNQSFSFSICSRTPRKNCPNNAYTALTSSKRIS